LLTIHLMAHEADFGRLVIPSGIIGEFPKEPSPDVSDASKKGFHEAAKFAERFMTENPEARPMKK